MSNVITSVEGERGCGYRVPGGRYLIGGSVLEACSLLPIPLTVCPTCSGGIKFSRGWTWIDATTMLGLPKPHFPAQHSVYCILGSTRDMFKVGLLWVGERSYTPGAFTKEAADLGVSRRIGYLPRGLKLGETVILLAHKKVAVPPSHMPKPFDGEYPEGFKEDVGPAIFSAFIPTRLEYVVKGDESEEELDRLEKKGYTLVKVVRKILGYVEESELGDR